MLTDVATVARAKTLVVVTDRVITDLASGYDLRVHHLCAELRAYYRVVNVVVDLYGGATHDRPLIPPLAVERIQLGRRVRALFRVNERDYLRLTNTAAFRSASETIGRTFRAEGAVAVMVFNAHVAAVVPPELRTCTVVDICDSVSLILKRRTERSPRTVVRSLVARYRWTRFEHWITATFAATVAVSAVDATAASAGDRSVRVVPNGVAARGTRSTGQERSVAFWGNLDFEPNVDAVESFVRDVVKRDLLPEGVVFRVIGRGAGASTREIIGGESRARLEGFQEDLAASLADAPIMINYMRLGSGIKNKVLEAFAMGIVVISTPRGVEGIENLEPGVHYVEASTPAEFGSAVRAVLADDGLRRRLADSANRFLGRYSWPRVGAELAAIVADVERAKNGLSHRNGPFGGHAMS